MLDAGTLSAFRDVATSGGTLSPEAILGVEGATLCFSALIALVFGAVLLSTGQPARGAAVLLLPFWFYNVLLRPINGVNPNRFVRLATLSTALTIGGAAVWTWRNANEAIGTLIASLEPAAEWISLDATESLLRQYASIGVLAALALAWGMFNAVVFSLLKRRKQAASAAHPDSMGCPARESRRGRLARYLASKSARRHERIWQKSLGELDCTEHGLWEFTADDGEIGRTRSYIGCRNMVILEMSRTPYAFRTTLTTKFANGDVVRTLESSDRRNVRFSEDELFSMVRRGLSPKEVLSCHLESVAEVAEANSCAVQEIEPHEVKVNLTHGGLSAPRQRYQGAAQRSATYSIEPA